MGIIKPSLIELFRRAAELRVLGKSWEAIGKELNRSTKTCRNWPSLQPELWRQALALAEKQALEEARHESVVSLRKLLRSEDEKIIQTAAAVLLKSTQPEPTDSSSSDEFRLLHDHLASLSHDQQQQLLENLLADQRRDPSPAVAATEAQKRKKRPE